jgi:predicted amidophosphoribosyltransferase
MATQKAGGVEAEAEAREVKTCPACGGTWPATRRLCIACGTSLESVPARMVGEGTAAEKLDWRWLDAFSPDKG